MNQNGQKYGRDEYPLAVALGRGIGYVVTLLISVAVLGVLIAIVIKSAVWACKIFNCWG